ncbi:glycosyl hydrolase [Planctomycetota bacterium]
MNRIVSVSVILVVVLLSQALGASLEESFKTPPIAYKSQPLWHMNGEMTTEGIKQQLQDARDKSGFSGVAVLPVRATRPNYLSEDYFARYQDILETCKSLGMNVIFYDDIGFPSGSAGGQMRKLYPDHILCQLDKLEVEKTGPTEWMQNLPTGDHMAAVAMNTKTFERRQLPVSADGKSVKWKVPPGDWKLMVFTCVRSKDNKVDYLCPESIDKFFSLTYDKYYERFADHFGSTIQMTFFDDVGLRKASRRNWTPAFNAKFEERHGYDPCLLYPALWHDIGPDTAAARVALYGFRAELLAEGFPRKVQEWASQHGVQSSGHAMAQYHPQPTFLAGDNIKFYEHSDIPMIDSIHYYGHGRPGFKFTSSAACCYDKPLVSVEIYGNYKGHFDTPMLYRSGMELFARGANVFLPHGMWYVPSTMRIPPLISDFNPHIAADLATYNEWVGRASLLLRGGRPVVDIAVLYPITALQAHVTLDAVVDQPKVKGNVHPGLCLPPENDLNPLSDSLTGGLRRDFTFLHPEILDDQCEIDGSLLKLKNKVNFQSYQVLVLPGARVIHWRTLQKIKAYYDAGGKIVATSALPSQSAEFGHDRDVQHSIAAIFGVQPNKPTPQQTLLIQRNDKGGMAIFIPDFLQNRSLLGQALDLTLAQADVRFADVAPTIDPKKGMLSYLHKVKDNRHIYFVANSTDKAIDTEVSLRGKLALQSWNPHSGKVRDIPVAHSRTNGVITTQTKLILDSLESLFLVEKNNAH